MHEDLNNIKKLLYDIIDKLDTQQKKEVLNIDEVADLTSLKKGYLYQLTAKGKIPSYSYSKKGTLFFKKSEIINWMTKVKRFYKNDIDDSLLGFA